MSTDLVKAVEQRSNIMRPPIGLALSIGEPKPEGRPGRPIDYFRPKEGELDQYAAAAEKFTGVYGEKPDAIDDVLFLSNDVGEVLDIRLKAWGSSGMRIIGKTNYALIEDEDEFLERAWSFIDDIKYFPLEAKEVPRRLRDEWEGEPIDAKLEGRDDPRVEQFQVGLETTLSFCLPRVMGIGTVAIITTKSRNSTRNLWRGVWDQFRFFNGQLIGIPFQLELQKKRSRYFDKSARKYKPTTVNTLVLKTPLTVSEVLEQISERRQALAALPAGDESIEGRALKEALALNPAEPVHLRDEPDDGDGPGDALLNRLAQLIDEAGQDAATVTLRGVFGKDTVEELSLEEAQQFHAILERGVAEDAGEGEIVSNGDDATHDGSLFELIPEDVKPTVPRPKSLPERTAAKTRGRRKR
jgi:hypothetical protein